LEHFNFLLTGGLGNQLLGVCQAAWLAQNTGLVAKLDFSQVEHGNYIEEIKDSIPSNCQNLFLFPDRDFFHENSNSNHIDVISLRKENLLSLDLRELKLKGWWPSLEMVKSTGIFTQKKIPDAWDRKYKREGVPTEIGLHLRLGDYLSWDALGGDITVTEKYLRKSLEYCIKETSYRHITLFSDQIPQAREVIGGLLPPGFEVEFCSSSSAVGSLTELSRSQFIVCANSTFSFWAAYFSEASCVFPKPFFPLNPKWEMELLDSRWIVVSNSTSYSGIKSRLHWIRIKAKQVISNYFPSVITKFLQAQNRK
jgi:hypothetical protein